MNFIFSNPAGFWALLGIPAVLAIHFLQRKARVLPVSTLFLLERTQREANTGRTFERIVPSIPLWMQLLGVLLLTWLVAEPRVQKPHSVQRIAIVLDASPSLRVTKDALLEKLRSTLPALQGHASACEFTVWESAPGRPRIYAGGSRDELIKALTAWQPSGGAQDVNQALCLARSLVSREGIVVFATDHTEETLPFDAVYVSAGEAIENVGFTGIDFTEREGALVWQGTVRNYSDHDVSRSWWLETADGRSETKSLSLGPKAVVEIQAALPKDKRQVRAVLSGDRFPTDDVLPIVAPRPKLLNWFGATAASVQSLTERLQRSLDGIEVVNDAAQSDLIVATYDPLEPVLPSGNAIVFVRNEATGGAALKGAIVNESHPLMDELHWNTLKVRDGIQLEVRKTDRILLRQGERPLIFLRDIAASAEKPAARLLCFNFDPVEAEVIKVPAFAVLVHRFVESVRSAKVAQVALNLETSQPFPLAAKGGADAKPLNIETFDASGKKSGMETKAPGGSLRAPAEPGYVTIRQGEVVLLDGAVHFGDTREADFSTCASGDSLAALNSQAADSHTDDNRWWRVAVLLLIAALVVAWRYTHKPEPVTT